MARRPTPTDLSSSDFNDETSSTNTQRKKSPKTKRDSIKDYVTNVLTQHSPHDVQKSTFTIESPTKSHNEYENISAFRRYQANNMHADNSVKVDSKPDGLSSSDEEAQEQKSTIESTNELNLDPNPIVEERESQEQVYTQKVYLRQLQPPTPDPVEIQVKEVLIKSQTQKPPIHVRVGQREPPTPPPIVIKTAPPQPPPPTESSEPIIYNKYVPPPKQPPQQIIIHHYPELPPKPRPIVVEQWLPYKPAPKRIIKHSLPPEALQASSAPRNIIVSYAKPRAIIEVELVRLPIVKIDPQTYQQISASGQDQLIQNPMFKHEQSYLSGKPFEDKNPINWRI